MKLPNFNFVAAADVRRAVVADGDIRGDIGFQNDINGLLARLDYKVPQMEALGLVREAVARPEAKPEEPAVPAPRPPSKTKRFIATARPMTWDEARWRSQGSRRT